MADSLTIRRSKAGDGNLVLVLLRELSEYERLTAKFFLTVETIERDFLGPAAAVICDLAFAGDEPVGLMTWYWTYNTFAAGRGVYLEDIYVRERHRGRGYGKALLAHLARQALAGGACQLKWSVLNWNAPSIGFYDSLGARPEGDWTVYALAGGPLQRLAQT
jgi:GNAT superfamily N-acetyltransferase